MDITLVVFPVVILVILYNNNRRKISKLQKEINEMKSNNIIINNSEKIDKHTVENFISLMKGDNVTLLSLNIIGDLKVAGNIKVNGNTVTDGHLTVKNGSDFYGGQHRFRDANCKNVDKEYVKIGNPWNMPGIHTPHDKIVIGNDVFQNIILHNNEIRFNNENYNGETEHKNLITIKDNVIQYMPGKYELNFGNDGWLRMYDIDTNNYSKNGFASNNLFAHDTGFIGSMHFKQNHIICPSSKSELFFENGYVYTLNNSSSFYPTYYRSNDNNVLE